MTIVFASLVDRFIVSRELSYDFQEGFDGMTCKLRSEIIFGLVIEAYKAQQY